MDYNIFLDRLINENYGDINFSLVANCGFDFNKYFKRNRDKIVKLKSWGLGSEPPVQVDSEYVHVGFAYIDEKLESWSDFPDILVPSNIFKERDMEGRLVLGCEWERGKEIYVPDPMLMFGDCSKEERIDLYFAHWEYSNRLLSKKESREIHARIAEIFNLSEE